MSAEALYYLLIAKRRRLDEASFTVYMNTSVSPSYARWQEERSTALDTTSFCIAINYSVCFQRPLVSYGSRCVAAASLIMNRPQTQIRGIPAAIRPPLDYKLTARAAAKTPLATAAADPFYHHYHLAHQTSTYRLCCPLLF